MYLRRGPRSPPASFKSVAAYPPVTYGRVLAVSTGSSKTQRCLQTDAGAHSAEHDVICQTCTLSSKALSSTRSRGGCGISWPDTAGSNRAQSQTSSLLLGGAGCNSRTHHTMGHFKWVRAGQGGSYLFLCQALFIPLSSFCLFGGFHDPLSIIHYPP